MAPGNSVGTVSVDGDLTLANGAAFNAELLGDGADALVADGTVELAGNNTLNIKIAGGPTAFQAGTYDLIDAGDLVGTFATRNVPMGIDGTEPSAADLAHMHEQLAKVAEATVGAFYVDDNMRNIPDHYHAHGRPEGGFFGHSIKRERLAEWNAAELD